MMILKRAALAAVFAAAAFGLPAVDKPAIDLTAVPAGPMKFTGSVCIVAHPGNQWLHMSSAVWAGGVRVIGGVMALMGQVMESGDYGYGGSKFGTSVRSGDVVTVTFQPPWPTLPLYTATLAAPLSLRFTGPANDAHVAVAGAGALAISWSGGTPPYRLSIKQVRGDRVFDQTGIGAASVSVPLATFGAGKRYMISVDDAGRKFAYDRRVDPASNLVLHQSTSIYFTAD